MVIASNSTSRRRGIRVLISLAHSTLSKAGEGEFAAAAAEKSSLAERAN
jgi:hypothetical protein